MTAIATVRWSVGASVVHLPSSDSDADMTTKSRALPEPRTGALLRFVRDAERCLAAGRLAEAERAALCALAMAPDDTAALTCFARTQVRCGRPAEAVAAFSRLLSLRPDDATVLSELAQAQAATAALDEAIATQRRRVGVQPDAAGWFDLGLLLDRHAECEQALDAARHALTLAPQHHAARFLVARALTALGRIDEAEAEYRALTAVAGDAARAWFGLADLKTVAFGDADITTMDRLANNPRASDDERLLAGFAAGFACEAAGRFAEALAHFRQANDLRRKTTNWNAAAHRRYCADVRHAFSAPLASAPAGLGEQVIFIVGMPRSGTTLVEQMLAAHPDVVGASELPTLEQVLQEESVRRAQPFPRWVGSASSADWERLGRRYLQLTERWQGRRRFTDKLPENWPYVGAALAMLPGARVIGCERDLLETCWSCYKQLFAPHRVAWSYDMDELASYAQDSRRLWAWWQQREPSRCRTLVHENLLADPSREIRELLAFCGLGFDVACLAPHEATRITRTASAAQIRQPLRRDTARGTRYGDLLAPLETALARAATDADAYGPLPETLS
jgi:tetratricopeptide (TPR) repeat protein